MDALKKYPRGKESKSGDFVLRSSPIRIGIERANYRETLIRKYYYYYYYYKIIFNKKTLKND